VRRWACSEQPRLCSPALEMATFRHSSIREEQLDRHLLDMTQRIVGALIAPSQFARQPDQQFGIGQ
jgi:hypothetical protein